MNFDDYKRTMLDIETPSGLNARTYSRIVQKDAGELLEEEPYVEPYAISAKAGRRPRKRYYVGIGACAAAALVGALIVVVLGTSAPQTSPAHSAAPPTAFLRTFRGVFSGGGRLHRGAPYGGQRAGYGLRAAG